MSESNSDESSSSSVPMPVLMPRPWEPHPLYRAIARGDLDEVKRMIAGLPVDCTHLRADCGSPGWTPLERACYSGQVDIVKFLIGEGADVQRCGQYSTTPLHSALFNARTNDHIACVKLLIAAGAEVNAARHGVQEPLIVTIQHYGPICRRIVRVLLQAGATISDQYLSLCGWETSQYLEKILKAGNFKAYAKAHRQKLVAMFVRTRCFQPVPDDIVPLIVDYGFHVGFY